MLEPPRHPSQFHEHVRVAYIWKLKCPPLVDGDRIEKGGGELVWMWIWFARCALATWVHV